MQFHRDVMWTSEEIVPMENVFVVECTAAEVTAWIRINRELIFIRLELIEPTRNLLVRRLIEHQAIGVFEKMKGVEKTLVAVEQGQT